MISSAVNLCRAPGLKNMSQIKLLIWILSIIDGISYIVVGTWVHQDASVVLHTTVFERKDTGLVDWGSTEKLKFVKKS